MRHLLPVLLCLSFPAWAQSELQVQVVVGKTAQVNVADAMGLNCDDLTIVQPKLVTSKDKTHNTLQLKGLAAGDTYCRVGTGLSRTVLIHIVVNEPPS